MLIRSFIILFLALLYSIYLAASPSSVFSQDSESKNQDLKICKIQQYIDENTYSSPEKWAWEKIRSGIPADFNTRYGKLDSARSLDWNRDEERRRAISSKFLEIILLDETCQKEIHHNGVHIKGAFFEEEINLENAELKHQLKLEGSRFEGMINFKRLTSPFGMSFKKSSFTRQFNISWADIKGPLEMDNVKFGLKVRARPRGVWVQETPVEEKEAEWVFMRGLKLGSDLTMNYGDFFPVDLQLARIGGRINLEKSHFRPSPDCPTGVDRPYCEESFLMVGSQIDGEINMKQAKFIGKVSLQGAEVGNIISMAKAIFRQELNMRGARLKSDFVMDDGRFQCVNLSLSKIEGQLTMENAEFLERLCVSEKEKPVGLDMRDIEIDSQLWMKKAKFHGIVRLSDASIGDQVNMEDTTFSDKLVMYGLRLNSRLTMKKGEFQEVALAGANIRRNLYLIEAKFNGELDLKLAKIGSVTSDNIEVESLDLTGTQVDNVVVKVPSIENFTEQPKSQGFPKKLKSQGFTYNQFLIQKKNNAKLNQDEREKLYKEWLNRLEKYNPQPYDMAAKVMRENGYPELATDLLFASKEKERIRACDDNNIPRCAGLWLLRLTTGYGLGARLLLRPLIWLIVLVLLGAFVYSRNPIKQIEKKDLKLEESPNSDPSLGKWVSKWVRWMAYSVDMILPIIKLREQHYNYDLQKDWQRYYFYIHQLFGWLMASFIFAGLAGITQG